MQETKRYSPAYVARRIAARTLHHLRGSRSLLLVIAGLGAIVVLASQFGLSERLSPAATAPSDDSAEQYMRALRDRDAVRLLGSLSPTMQRAVEQRFGRLGPAAVAAMFSEQEQRGERVIGYQLVGSYEAVQGDELRFYVVHVQRGNDRGDVPYTLTIGSDGKVSKVE